MRTLQVNDENYIPMQRNVAEHEVFLSFVNDSDAELFREWLATHGWVAFKTYGGYA